jgi:nicotinamide N-methyltransferase
LARYLLDKPSLVTNKRTIELGAGTALPSLVALSLGSSLSVLTDYPHDHVLQSLRLTVGYNWEACYGSPSRVAVLGHEWGSDVTQIFHKVETMMGAKDTNCNSSFHPFHVIFLSECLWNHAAHDKLATSIHNLLHPTEGLAIVTYAHHVPGKEREDDAFFSLCQDKYHFITHHISHQSMPYMWDSTKTIDIYLKVLRRGLL